MIKIFFVIFLGWYFLYTDYNTRLYTVGPFSESTVCEEQRKWLKRSVHYSLQRVGPKCYLARYN